MPILRIYQPFLSPTCIPLLYDNLILCTLFMLNFVIYELFFSIEKCVNLDEYARAYDDKAIKKTLTIPAWLNSACENAGINYSKVLKDALIAKLQAQS